jgi:hypothetical protein
MRIGLLIVGALVLGACSGTPDVQDPAHSVDAVSQDVEPEANAAAGLREELREWREFLQGTRVQRELEFVDESSENRATWTYVPRKDEDRLDTIRRGQAEGAGSSSHFSGGVSMSYNPELHSMGLKVGRDGNLHRIGHDARDARDPDEGPAVDWEELHRKQFGH